MTAGYNEALCNERHAALARQRAEDREWIRDEFEDTRELIRGQSRVWIKFIPWIVAALLAGGGGGTLLKNLPVETPVSVPAVQGSDQK